MIQRFYMTIDETTETQMANTTSSNLLSVFIFKTNFSECKPSLNSETE
jgi:hypothetical protein